MDLTDIAILVGNVQEGLAGMNERLVRIEDKLDPIVATVAVHEQQINEQAKEASNKRVLRVITGIVSPILTILASRH